MFPVSPTIPPVSEGGGLSDEGCFLPVRRSASQCCRPANGPADAWRSSPKLKRCNRFATDICDIRTADVIELACLCKLTVMKRGSGDYELVAGRFAIFSRPAGACNTRGGAFNGSVWYTGAGIHFHSGLPAVRSGDDAAESRRQEVTKLFSGDNLSNRGSSPENYRFWDKTARHN